MPSLSTLVILLVFAIPILSILLAGYKEWLEFRAEQGGPAVADLEAELAALRDRLDRVEQERDALVSRLQNLETIVTSEAWDARLESPDAASPLDAPPEADRESPDDAPSTSEQAEALARRLRG